MKRSTERYIIRGVILVLCVLLALPVLWLLIIFFGPEVTCMIHNLGQDDPAVRAASKITEREPGVLDFRALAGDYDHICLVDDQYDLEDQSLPGNAPRAHRVGRELCGNYKKYGPVFGLVSGGTFIFLRHWFGSLPPAPGQIQNGPNCMPTAEAVIHCFERAWPAANMHDCVFKPN
jgi:hypothetical protein